MRFRLTLGLLLLLAPAAQAAGLNLAWDHCLPDGGVNVKKFACTSNAGVSEVVGSFIPAQVHPRFVGIEVQVEVQSESTALPDWWQVFNSGSCRESSISAAMDFTRRPQGGCSDPFGTTAFGGIGAYVTANKPRPDYQPRPNSARLMMAAAIMGTSTLSAGTEYYCVWLTIDHESSASGACSGCSSPVCLTLSQVTLYDDTPIDPNGGQSQPPVYERITTVAQNNLIGWQDTGPACQSNVKNKTWGQLKSLYR